MRHIKKLLVAFFTLIFIFPLASIYAQVDEIQLLEDELVLKLPEETDNPSYAVTFVDPSDQGVFLSIDDGEEREVNNPYQLPALSIGEHTLLFRYTDKLDTEKSGEVSIIIVPRSPSTDTPTIEDGQISVSGKALSNSTVVVNLMGRTDYFIREVESDNDGNWSLLLEDEPSSSYYSVFATTKKRGYSSQPSEPITFALEKTENDNTSTSETTVGDDPVSFTFSEFMSGNQIETLKSNPDLSILIAGTALTAMLVGVLVSSLMGRVSDRKAEKQFMQKLSSSDEKKSSFLSGFGKKEKASDKDDSSTSSETTEPDEVETAEMKSSMEPILDEEVSSASSEPEEATKEEEPEPADDEEVDESVEEDDEPPVFSSSDEEEPAEAESEVTPEEEATVDDEQEEVSESNESSEGSEKQSFAQKIFDRKSFLDKFRKHDPDPEADAAMADQTNSDHEDMTDEDYEVDHGNDSSGTKGLTMLLKESDEEEPESEDDEQEEEKPKPKRKKAAKKTATKRKKSTAKKSTAKKKRSTAKKSTRKPKRASSAKKKTATKRKSTAEKKVKKSTSKSKSKKRKVGITLTLDPTK